MLAFEGDYHDLPAGRALSIDTRWEVGTKQRDYLYTDGEVWFGLQCAAKATAAEDRWLSIAETFEFLPEAE